MSFRFKRIDKCWQDARYHTDKDVDFYLEENNWNDYGFYTMYHLHAAGKLTGGTPEYLGSLRIMSLSQKEGDIYLLDKQFKNDVFEELPENFVSLSMDLDLYNGLNRYLDTEDKRRSIVKALHLIMGSESPYYYPEVRTSECFKNSLLRDTASLDNFALEKGRELLSGSLCYYNLRKESITVKYANVERSIELHFSSVEDDNDDRIPNGVLVFIGKNGSGKSTSIYRLAKLIYTDPTQRFRLRDDVGELDPNNIGVSRLFLISYSPFDNFILPTIYDKDYLRLLKSGNDGSSRFVFCGIRDIVNEDVVNIPENGEFDENKIVKDRQNKTALKDISILASEFSAALEVVKDSHEEEWNNFLNRCKIEQSSLYEDIIGFDEDNSKESICARFMSLSTGHKFFMHSFVRVMAYIDNNSLLLFDEPENHLHPPLLSFMMSEFRKILAKNRSVMFIATHSPVIVQETFARNVFVVRKMGGVTTITRPRIETYGANLSTIASDVFDLTTTITKYHDAIRYLYKKWDMEYQKDVETMLSEYEKNLGHGLTDQMEAYLISLFMEDNDVEA